ncbi:MAG: hypothetical protein CME36_01395 [unclassified Hahellaceae]|nr:hypothetical protein [Hahellaceae bacterium]|tara:strand:- start:7578 stop:8528 length:951 start_codon:yes stop_codon:yes gene_type:complete
MAKTTAVRLIKSSSDITPLIQLIPASTSFPQPGQGQFLVVRGDCIGAAGEGNKYFKLLYNLPSLEAEAPPVVSVGGPWSNHLHALAHACAARQLTVHGFIRGLDYSNTPTIDTLRSLGMQLHHLDRVTYRAERDQQWQGLPERLGLASDQVCLLPEGGSNAAAVRGVRVWARSIFDALQPSAVDPVTLYVGAGTGATMAGFICEASEHCRIVGVPAGRFGNWLGDAVTRAIAAQAVPVECEWVLEDGGDAGNFGRMTDWLRDFISGFDREYGIRLDPVYTGKVARVALEGVAHDQRRHVMIHTGGLQRAAFPVLQE